MAPLWRVELFGGVRVVRHDATVMPLRAQKAAALLAYLAYFRRPHPRELLIEQFWGDDDLPTARHKLSVALSALRQVLEPPGAPAVIEADRNFVRLAPGVVATDVDEFNEGMRLAAGGTDCAGNLARSIALYQGELLAGYYENWIFPEQQRFANRFLEALREMVALQVESGNKSGAVETALRAVAVDPLSEALHLEVMRLQLLLDRPAAALRHYREVERVLREELDTAPTSAFKPLLSAARAALEAESVSEAAERSPEPPKQAPAAPPPSPVSTPSGAPTRAPQKGALPIGSPFYVSRQADAEVVAAIRAQSSIVLLKGARQVGKTSLLGRALQQARDAGAHIVSTDFHGFSGTDLESAETLLRALAAEIVDQLDLDVDPYGFLEAGRSPAVGFRRFLKREVLGKLDGPLVWGLDEVDRLFATEFHSEMFALFRSWHNQRVLDPMGPWHRFTQVIAYATEAHLFITDIHQSPFNVGVRIELADFSLPQVADLNERHGSPLRSPQELDRLHDLLNGHPYLVQQGLSFASHHGWSALEPVSDSEEGPFAEHLRRLLLLLGRSPELCEAVRVVLRGRPCPTLEDFVRLRSGGILAGASTEQARPRCRLYAEFLSRHLL